MIELEILKKTLEKDDSKLKSATDLNERLVILSEIVGGKSALSRLTGISPSGLNRYLDGGEPGSRKLDQICEKTDLNPMFMLRGELPIFLSDEFSSAESSEFAYVPAYDVSVAAGHGSEPCDEEPSRRLAFRRRWLNFRGLHAKDLLVVYAKGDSMEPNIEDGNSLLVDTSQILPADGGIYVLRNEGQLVVKRTQHLLGEGILLISDNKAYKEQVIPANGSNDLQVLGKVVWIGKDVQ